MKRSEKLLLAVFIAALLAWQGSGLVQRILLAPLDQQQAELDALNDAIAKKEDQQLQLMRIEKQLRNRIARSLPPEPLTAQRLYQSWLTDLAQDCGLGNLKVFPGRITNNSKDLVGVFVSIQAETRLDQLCLFLDRFYRTDVLHRLTSLSLDSQSSQPNPSLRITLVAEGIYLQLARQ